MFDLDCLIIGGFWCISDKNKIRLKFSSDDSMAKYQCKIDNGNYTECEFYKNTTVLATYGIHNIYTHMHTCTHIMIILYIVICALITLYNLM